MINYQQHVGNESCQNSVGESYNMKEVGNYGPTPSERKNDVHENDVCGSSSGSVEVPATATSDDFWDSLEISDESLDGEVGKRLNQMVPIPVSVALVQPLYFVLKTSCVIFYYNFQLY